jgi:hypothetical protein
MLNLGTFQSQRKKTIGFSILDLKNRTATGRFGPVPVRFGFLFFFFWFGCFLEVKTEPNRK